LRSLVIAIFSSFLGGACATPADKLPAGLHAPDRGVVCDGGRGVCFDRFGPSIGLTEAFLGPASARALTSSLREMPRSADLNFSLGENITCRRGTGPCHSGETVHEALTAALYGMMEFER
jgi:Fels-1 prophage protein